MFYYNIFYQWGIFSEGAVPNGAIIHLSSIDATALTGRDKPDLFPDTVLFDPSLYFLDLLNDLDDSKKTIERLSSHNFICESWIIDGESVIPQDPEQIKRCVESCIDTQIELDANKVIIPTPLISDSSEDVLDEKEVSTLRRYLDWIDTSISMDKLENLPFLLSVPMTEDALVRNKTAIIDNLTSRDRIKGIYFILISENSERPVFYKKKVASALLEISFQLGYKHGIEVLINYADTFGLACLASGATSFASGYNRKGRRLMSQDYEEKGGGAPYPRFFSLTTNRRYLPISELEIIRDANLLRLLDKDITEFSLPLFNALRTKPRGPIPEWEERRGNIGKARAHLITRITAEVNQIQKLDYEERIKYVLNWLQNADMFNEYLDVKLEKKDTALDDTGSHVSQWLAAFEQFIAENELPI